MVKRILIGQLPDGGYGMRVSQPGYDVTSNPVDNEKLIFSSDWQSLLPVHATGTITVNNSTVTQNFTNLGYIPHSTSLVKVLTSGWPTEWQQYVTGNSILTPRVNYSAGTTLSIAQLYSFNSEDNAYANLRINVLSNSISVYSTLNLQVFYTIYKLQAF